MGILRKTEELLPVTCAVLAEDVRQDFFSEIRKRASGNLGRIALIADTTTSVVSDWISGRKNVPYHSLQVLSREFGLEPPPVSELRRELQEVVHTPKARTASDIKAELGEERRPRREPREGRGRERRERPHAGRQPHKREPQAQAPRRERRPRQPQQKSPRPRREEPRQEPGKGPKLSAELAYWTGVVLAGGRRQAGEIYFSADRRVGQNFASTWGGLTSKLFRVKPSLSMSADHKVQTASLPVAGLEELLSRIEFQEGTEPPTAPGAPRWTWSNPEWKAAFLRGVVDVCCHFTRTPALRIVIPSERLRRSVQKILASIGIDAKDGGQGELCVEGREAVEKYLQSVGTENLKLRDQTKAFLRGRPPRDGTQARPEAREAPADADPEASHDEEPREAGESAEPETAAFGEVDDESSEDAVPADGE
ncbi:MAG: hypothetical protein WC728_00375 [Elusimicrobiota bacterium]